ncbi:MAG: hypothetical protein A3G87_05005 [Omnitrophica bacterium RIFCSPLOWO2_12_FULL_50_11]|nr:MAG: hypothetical protein A3G87_05005 [Omnitrophica bacterium RIFCSPLOWO2_12_FULL_50_11]
MGAPFGNLWGNLTNLAKLAKDEHFRTFLETAKVRELMKDPEFKRAVEEKNVFKLMCHQGFTELMKDPQIRTALEGIGKQLKKSE